MLDDSYEIDCPYCGVKIMITPDPFGGKRQTLMEECSNCDKPIRLELEWEGNDLIRLEAFQESE